MPKAEHRFRQLQFKSISPNDKKANNTSINSVININNKKQESDQINVIVDDKRLKESKRKVGTIGQLKFTESKNEPEVEEQPIYKRLPIYWSYDCPYINKRTIIYYNESEDTMDFFTK